MSFGERRISVPLRRPNWRLERTAFGPQFIRWLSVKQEARRLVDHHLEIVTRDDLMSETYVPQALEAEYTF